MATILTKVRPTSDIRDLSSHTPAKGTTDGKQQLAAVAHPARKTIKATVRCEGGADRVSCTTFARQHAARKSSSGGAGCVRRDRPSHLFDDHARGVYRSSRFSGHPTRLFRSVLMDSKQHPTITMSVERVAACDGARCCVHRRMAT
jgi:hypothetical protein